MDFNIYLLLSGNVFNSCAKFSVIIPENYPYINSIISVYRQIYKLIYKVKQLSQNHCNDALCVY